MQKHSAIPRWRDLQGALPHPDRLKAGIHSPSPALPQALRRRLLPSSPPAYPSGSGTRSLPMRAPTRALSRWKQSGPAESRARTGRAARLAPPEPSAPRGVHPSPPGLPLPFPRCPPPSTEARLHEEVLGDQHSGLAARAAGGQPGVPSSSSLLASQSDMAAPPARPPMRRDLASLEPGVR